MKKIVFLLLTLISCSLLAQGGNRYAAKRVFEFRKSTTIVILDDLVRGKETEYNIALKKAIEGYWKITPTMFKRQSELTKLLPLKGFSLLVKSTRIVMNADGYTFQKHADLSVFMADKDSLNFYGGIDEIASVEIFDTQDPVEVTYKMPLLLMGIQRYVDFISKDGGIDFYDFQNLTEKFFNKNKKAIHKDTLYICREDFPSEINLDEFGKIYKHPYKVITRSDLPPIIAEGGNGFVFHTDMGYKHFWVLRIKDGAVCYHATPHTKSKLTKQDINKL